jgi:hypothetical protein
MDLKLLGTKSNPQAIFTPKGHAMPLKNLYKIAPKCPKLMPAEK